VDEKKSTIGGLLGKARAKFVSFRELLTGGGDRYDKVVTFVSLLEMIRDGLVKAKQSGTFSDIKLTGSSGQE